MDRRSPCVALERSPFYRIAIAERIFRNSLKIRIIFYLCGFAPLRLDQRERAGRSKFPANSRHLGATPNPPQKPLRIMPSKLYRSIYVPLLLFLAAIFLTPPQKGGAQEIPDKQFLFEALAALKPGEISEDQLARLDAMARGSSPFANVASQTACFSRLQRGDYRGLWSALSNAIEGNAAQEASLTNTPETMAWANERLLLYLAMEARRSEQATALLPSTRTSRRRGSFVPTSTGRSIPRRSLANQLYPWHLRNRSVGWRETLRMEVTERQHPASIRSLITREIIGNIWLTCRAIRCGFPSGLHATKPAGSGFPKTSSRPEPSLGDWSSPTKSKLKPSGN